MIKEILFYLLFLILICLPIALREKPKRKVAYGKVITVLDGDTAIIRFNGNEHRVRFLYIDAPELEQITKEGLSIGLMSKLYLQELIDKKQVRIVYFQKDKYRRYLAEIYVNNQFVNYQMIKAGQAFVYPRAKFTDVAMKHQFYSAFDLAKLDHLGIFKLEKFQTPWSFRKRMKSFKARML